MTVLWAIKHKPSGHYLPRIPGKHGGTYVEPEPVDRGRIRLFREESHAKCALKWWLAGHTYVVWFAGSFDEDGDADWRTKPVPGRCADDMAIVRVELREVTE